MMNSNVKAAITAGIVAGIALVAAILKRAVAERTATGEKSWEAADMVGGRAGAGDAFTGATRDELYAEAKRRGVRGRSKMTKAELRAALAKRSSE